jgi:TetR/AcrR family transcriptional regulator, mexJK operon transcriptional repressor
MKRIEAPQSGALPGRDAPAPLGARGDDTPSGLPLGGGEAPFSGAPLEGGAFKRGPGGRPTREEAERRHRSLLATAFRLFLEKGWAGVSVEEISRQSGVAKGFIYARYPDKSALFAGAIQRLMEDAIGTLQIAGPLPDDVEEGLFNFGRKLLDLALRPEALACHRQLIADAARFPELARQFVDRNRLLGMVAAVLEAYAARGALKLGDVQTAAAHFSILVVGVPRMLALLSGREPPPEEERRLRAAIRLFLDGCRAG